MVKTKKPKPVLASLRIEVLRDDDHEDHGRFTDEDADWNVCRVDEGRGRFVRDLVECHRIVEECAEKFGLEEGYGDGDSAVAPRGDWGPAADWIEEQRHGVPDDLLAEAADHCRTLHLLWVWERPRRGRAFNYFEPPDSGEEAGSWDYRRCALEDWKRAESLNDGEWWYVGVRAVAEVRCEIAPGYVRVERFKSEGLWGVESDSGDYLKEVAREQLQDLKAHVGVFGVVTKGWDKLAEAAVEEMDI